MTETVIPLRNPIRDDAGQLVTELRVRHPSLAEVRRAGRRRPTKKSRAWAVSTMMTGLSRATLARLTGQDAAAAEETIAGILDVLGREAGLW
ncbi:Phage tail assembly chaperone protein, E, or 41 or 14 [Tistlia consotensis]|uniref:Phage tail assembly chaperone protein, E, or 41 or 14 n=1 Tax=Tistlia consotensis USBA 355 TaxID=560819 RepID=A0A1Y6CNE4_9PROT|nr:phage tail assembly protein [Tistlia consotensis]SMF42094.1 Phage tail assembly chaperone protein, E, or 41 or 14 [Tistlia consotensis USBA 355]SMF66282.1 Phage tail assembly chaperone protein, E, or 41 or 14 [Tistlia consotensis USBA 355]SNR73102.1 Phage tail assembly chaperone protein, E, or 41 or 14 [Tistlia consotensis]